MPSLCSMPPQRRSLRSPSDPSALIEEFRRQEQREAARPGRRAGQPRKNKVDDILRHVVLAVGDEDFLAEEAVGSILCAFRSGLDCAEVGAGLRLGEVHRPGPPAADHRSEINVGELARAVRFQRPNGALGQERAQGEGHRRAVPDFGAGDVDEMRQPHAPEFRRRRDAAPARVRPTPVYVGEAVRHRHKSVFVARAREIASAVERRDFVGGEAPCLCDDGRNGVPVEIAGEPRTDQLGQAGHRIEREQDICDWRTIRHRRFLRVANAGGA